VTESTAKLHNQFLARFFRKKGIKRNLTASSPNCGIRIMRHTSSRTEFKQGDQGKKITNRLRKPWGKPIQTAWSSLEIRRLKQVADLRTVWKLAPRLVPPYGHGSATIKGGTQLNFGTRGGAWVDGGA